MLPSLDEFVRAQELHEMIVSESQELSEIESKELLTAIHNSGLNESFLKKAFGTATGLVLGKRVASALLKLLGVKSGPLFNVLTSKVVQMRIGYEFGSNI